MRFLVQAPNFVGILQFARLIIFWYSAKLNFLIPQCSWLAANKFSDPRPPQSTISYSFLDLMHVFFKIQLQQTRGLNLDANRYFLLFIMQMQAVIWNLSAHAFSLFSPDSEGESLRYPINSKFACNSVWLEKKIL